ncbi:MAG: DUF4349 domain-containing protein [Leptospiraceae bacterium]|nr:DUF4349 domain-containing protein [Leptospiraceae bacterium]
MIKIQLKRFQYQSLRPVVLILICLLLSATGCSNESPATGGAESDDMPLSEADGFFDAEEAPAEQATARSMDEDGDLLLRNERERSQQQAPGSPEVQSGEHQYFVMPFEKAEGRLLEYRITLSYKSEQFADSRLQLLKIVDEYGYLLNAHTETEDAAFMNVQMRVKAEDVYKTLRELDAIGTLETENIDVIDHTENMVLAERKYRREQIRGARRVRGGQNLAAKDWAERERLIAESEDREDAAAHEQWQIRDRVAWATFNVQVQGPDPVPGVEAPQYTRALIGLVNLLLDLLYVLLWISPLIALGAGIWYGVRRLMRGHRQRKQTGN